MNIQEQIEDYISSFSGTKQTDMEVLHKRILKALPNCKLWFLNGQDDSGKIVSNPNIGYGFQTLKQAGAKTRDFYQIGISGNSVGISVYILGIENKKHLMDNYSKTIGKAKITGYCIKFKTLKEIQIDILEAAILDGFERTGPKQIIE